MKSIIGSMDRLYRSIVSLDLPETVKANKNDSKPSESVTSKFTGFGDFVSKLHFRLNTHEKGSFSDRKVILVPREGVEPTRP